MPQDSAPTTPTTPADVANAKNRNLSLSQIAGALSDSSSSFVTALTSIASAITASIVGGTTGTTANRLLRSKGTGGFALQNSAVGCDNSGNLTGIGNLNASGTVTADAGVFTSSLTKGGIAVATLNTNTWLQQQGFARATLTDASTITWNAQTQQSAYVLLTAAVGATRALGAPSNQVDGFTYILRVQQSSAGGNALTFNSVYKWPGAVVPTLSTAANAVDVLTFVSDGTNMNGVIQKAFG